MELDNDDSIENSQESIINKLNSAEIKENEKMLRTFSNNLGSNYTVDSINSNVLSIGVDQNRAIEIYSKLKDKSDAYITTTDNNGDKGYVVGPKQTRDFKEISELGEKPVEKKISDLKGLNENTDNLVDNKSLEQALQDYQSSYANSKHIRSELSTIPGYVRKKSEEEVAYHNVKHYFGDFSPTNKDAMKANDNGGNGVIVDLPNGKETVNNQLELYYKVVAFNKNNGSFFNEDYIENTNKEDLSLLKRSQNDLNDSKKVALSFYDDKKEGQKVLTNLELEIGNNWRKPSETQNNVDELIKKKEYVKNSVSFSAASSSADNEMDKKKGQEKKSNEEMGSSPLSGNKNKEDLATSLPSHIFDHYTQKGENFYDKNAPKKVAFVDRVNLLVTDHNKDQYNESLVSIAKHREWPNIYVDGSTSFKRDIWKKASEQGMVVHGYTPSVKEVAALNISKEPKKDNHDYDSFLNRIKSVSEKIEEPEKRQSDLTSQNKNNKSKMNASITPSP